MRYLKKTLGRKMKHTAKKYLPCKDNYGNG